MARLIGWGYEKGDYVQVTCDEAVDHLGDVKTSPVPTGTVLLAVDDGPDGDGEVLLTNPTTQGRYYVHFTLLTPAPRPEQFQTPEDIEAFLQKEDPWK